MHVIGATGTGKSTLLQSCIVQDIHLGNGIAVLDPHGDLIESILPYIPENRYDDVVIIDPSDGEFPVGFNILNAHSDVEKEILASDLVAVFRRLSTSFGDQMHSVLANAILAFLESTEGGTLMDLRRFLIEKDYRSRFLKTVSDPSVVYYWQKEYPLLKSNSIGPILTRLDSFLRPKLIRNMVAQKKSLDFESLMDNRKIVLIKLSQGLIGTENSYLLGTFFVSKIYQTAMARQAKSKDSRANFYMYIDEFQNFVTPSMSSILSGTRKYGLGCILAHQDMSQLQKYDTELANAVVSNAGTRVCFKIGDIDAKRFAEGFSSFEVQDIQNLGTGQAIARIERPEFDFTISTLQLKDIESEQAVEIKYKVIALSQEMYGTPREEVERSLEFLREEKAQEADPKPKKEQVVIPPSPNEEAVETLKQEVQEKVTSVEIQANETKARLVKQKELSEHRYMQMFIKKMAEARGFTAKIEEPTPDGGRVDVTLERNGKRIACEIGMTTTADWELHNIEKCIDAGYDLVVAIAKNRNVVKVIEKKIRDSIDNAQLSKVMVIEAEALFEYLDVEIARKPSTETRVKGYRVKVEYGTVSDGESKRKTQARTKVVVDSIKKNID
ncbi:MAG: type IV secretion system DNA-binding domain-containing protein [Bacteroidetes bacterium]|nr:type IV secretion system DNA-binding domain-containing protein [Bacteroidota bacterium]